MLRFGMETKRINDIVNAGAATRMNDTQFLERELLLWLNSPERRMQIQGDMYYDYTQDISLKRRLIISEDKKLVEDETLPNYKIIDNQYAKMVDQKVNYILSKPLTFKTADENYSAALKRIFTKKFYRTFKNVGKDSYNGAVGYLYPYYDESGDGILKFKRFHPWEIKVYWKDDDKTEIDFFWRYYEVLGYEGSIEHVYKFLDVYDTNGIHKFEYRNGGLVPNYSTYHFELDIDDQTVEYNWNRVPLIPFKSNSSMTPLLVKCKSLQDAINRVLSEFGDGMEENASGNTILIIKNYDGEDLGTFRRNLAAYKAVKVKTVDGADGGIDSLEINVNAANYELITELMKKALIQNCKGYDVEALKSSGSPNEMTIKAIYSDIDLDANEIETEYQASMEDLLWFVNRHLMATGQGDYLHTDVDVIFNRDMMVNESQVITDINNSSGLLSKKTLISQHPWVSDVSAELEQLREEQEEAMNVYGNSFTKKVADNADSDAGDIEDEAIGNQEDSGDK